MARARELTFSECLFTVLLFALIHTITAKDVAPVSYLEGDNYGVMVDTHLVRERRQVQGATSSATTPTTTTTAVLGNGTGPTGTPGNDTTKNEAGVTSAPSTLMPTPAPPAVSTQSPMRTTTIPVPSTTANVSVIENDVKYYTIRTMQQSQTADKYWTQLTSLAEVHSTLSEGHRLAQTLPLKFEFRFYGHPIRNVTIATGGFLYMSPFLHKFLTATQYIAPLMANFDTSLGNESHIRYQSTADQFIVRWENVHLKDQVEFGSFNFQAHLKKSGDIVFVYRSVPVSVTKIVEDNHPVKVGLSDAFYIDKDDKKLGMKRRTIYEYHRVQINVTQVKNSTLVILKPNPTCNTAQTCETCLNNLALMGCRWCGVVQRCSDGIDWNRQDWLDKGCKYLSSGKYCHIIPPITSTKATATTTSSSAPTTTRFTAATKLASLSSRPVSVSSRPQTVTKTPVLLSSASSSVIKTPTSLSSVTKTPVSLSSKSFSVTKTPTSLSSVTKTAVSRSPVTLCAFAKSGNGNCSEIVNAQPTKAPQTSKGDGMGFPPGAVVAIIIIVALVIGIGGWLFYAYRNPTTPSGMWLMEHRPVAMKTKLAKMKFWKQSTPTGDKYAVETEA